MKKFQIKKEQQHYLKSTTQCCTLNQVKQNTDIKIKKKHKIQKMLNTMKVWIKKWEIKAWRIEAAALAGKLLSALDIIAGHSWWNKKNVRNLIPWDKLLQMSQHFASSL